MLLLVIGFRRLGERGIKRKAHILLRMEGSKQVCVKCKESIDMDLFDGFEHCLVRRKRKGI